MKLEYFRLGAQWGGSCLRCYVASMNFIDRFLIVMMSVLAVAAVADPLL